MKLLAMQNTSLDVEIIDRMGPKENRKLRIACDRIIISNSHTHTLTHMQMFE